LDKHQQPKAKQAITIACHQEPRPVMLSEDSPTNGTGEVDKKKNSTSAQPVKALN